MNDAELIATAPTPCKRDPEGWFALYGGSPTADERRRVRACRYSCPVRLACGRHADRLGERNGIWAGFAMTRSDERDALKAWLKNPVPEPVELPVENAAEALIEHPERVYAGDCPQCRRPQVKNNALGRVPSGWSRRQNRHGCVTCVRYKHEKVGARA